MALPGKLDLTFVAGDRFTKAVQIFTALDEDGVPIDPLDLTGATIKAQAREKPLSATVRAEFVILNAETLTDDGVVILRLETTQTQPFNAWPQSVWDMQVTTADGDVQTRLAGKVKAKLDVTRA